MEEILSKADELGVLIRETAVYAKFNEIGRAVESDNEASLLLKKYNEIAETIQQKQTAGETVEKYEQERFRELSVLVSSSPLLLDYLRARDGYIELLSRIHEALSGENE